jgi:hypothetical protein
LHWIRNSLRFFCLFPCVLLLFKQLYRQKNNIRRKNNWNINRIPNCRVKLNLKHNFLPFLEITLTNFLVWRKPKNMIEGMSPFWGRSEWHFSRKHVYDCHQQTPSLEENLNQFNISTKIPRLLKRFVFMENRLLGKSTKGECFRIFTIP